MPDKSTITDEHIKTLATKLMIDAQAKMQQADPVNGQRNSLWLEYSDFVAEARRELGLPQIPPTTHEHG